MGQACSLNSLDLLKRIGRNFVLYDKKSWFFVFSDGGIVRAYTSKSGKVYAKCLGNAEPIYVVSLKIDMDENVVEMRVVDTVFTKVGNVYIADFTRKESTVIEKIFKIGEVRVYAENALDKKGRRAAAKAINDVKELECPALVYDRYWTARSGFEHHYVYLLKLEDAEEAEALEHKVQELVKRIKEMGISKERLLEIIEMVYT